MFYRIDRTVIFFSDDDQLFKDSNSMTVSIFYSLMSIREQPSENHLVSNLANHIRMNKPQADDKHP